MVRFRPCTPGFCVYCGCEGIFCKEFRRTARNQTLMGFSASNKTCCERTTFVGTRRTRPKYAMCSSFAMRTRATRPYEGGFCYTLLSGSQRVRRLPIRLDLRVYSVIVEGQGSI